MREIVSKLKGKTFKDVVISILSSEVLPFFVGAFVLLFYYLGLDLATIYILALTGAAMVLLLDDLTPLVPHLAYLHVIISMQNSPSYALEHADYYLLPQNLVQIGIVIAVFFVAVVVRLVFLAKDKTFKPSPVFFGLCAFALALTLNGVFASGYSLNNLAYGVVLAIFFLVIYVLISSNVKLSEENYKRIGWGFFAFSLVVLTELAAKFIVNWPEIFDADGEIIRDYMKFGWGIWNTIGMLIVISIPMVMSLASRYKHGYLFIFYAALLAASVFATTSRQSMVGAALVFPASLVVAIIKNKNRAGILISTAVLVVAGAVVVAIGWPGISRSLGNILDNLFGEDGMFTGNGRIPLMQTAVQYFAEAPVFGKGFHLNFSFDVGIVGLDGFVPLMAHNTFAELLATCGMVGFLAYLIHRIQTIVAFAEHVTVNKTYAALCISILLILSLLDNHIFYIFPTIIYSSLLPFAIGGTTQGRAVLSNRRKAGPESTIIPFN